MTFEINDRVYYTDNGSDDTGTVISVSEHHVEVRWDVDGETDEYFLDQVTKV